MGPLPFIGEVVSLRNGSLGTWTRGNPPRSRLQGAAPVSSSGRSPCRSAGMWRSISTDRRRRRTSRSQSYRATASSSTAGASITRIDFHRPLRKRREKQTAMAMMYAVANPHAQ